MRAPGGTRRPARRDDADREGDVGGHGDAPAAGAGVPGVERGEDEGGHDHAAEGGDGRERCGAPVAQLAGDQLALDLQAGQQEEQGHQPVVDEPWSVHVELRSTRPSWSRTVRASKAS